MIALLSLHRGSPLAFNEFRSSSILRADPAKRIQRYCPSPCLLRP